MSKILCREKRLMRSIVVGLIGSQEAKRMLASDFSYMLLSMEGDSSDEEEENREEDHGEGA